MPSSRSPFPSPALRVPLRYGSEMRLDGIRKASSPLMSFPLPLPSLERSEGQRTEVAKEVGKEVIRLMNETTTEPRVAEEWREGDSLETRDNMNQEPVKKP